jgi:cardiolipin synthase
MHFSSKSDNTSKESSSSSSSSSSSDKGVASNGDKILEDSLNRVYTIPNMITLSRILLCPFLYYAIEQDMKTIALGGVVYCAFTDWLDGYIAKKFNSSSRFGAFIDPLAGNN